MGRVGSPVGRGWQHTAASRTLAVAVEVRAPAAAHEEAPMPAPSSEAPLPETRPVSAVEKERFSSGGRPHLLILRGKWGLAIDKAIVWTTGWSLVTAQYAWANGAEYTPTLMLYTIGARTGSTRSACLPYFRVGDDLVLRDEARTRR